MDTLMAGHQKNEKKESDTAFVFEKTLMILLVSAAVVLDFKTWRIPNWLVLIGMETGIFVTIQREGWRMGGIQVVLGMDSWEPEISSCLQPLVHLSEWRSGGSFCIRFCLVGFCLCCIW